MARNIGIISIKGGVGKTSLTAALGAALTKEFNKKVLLVDANFSAPNLALHLGLIDPEVTLHHVLSDKVNVENSIYESEHGFHLIPGSIIYNQVNAFKLRSKLKPLQRYYDAILIDSSPSMNNEILASIIASDEIYLVTTPDRVTLQTTLNTIKLAKEKQIPIRGIIVNKVYGKRFEVSLKKIEELSGCKVLAMLPHDIRILKSLSQMNPIDSSSKIKFSREIKKLAGSIIGERHELDFFDKIKNFFNIKSRQDINREELLLENMQNLD